MSQKLDQTSHFFSANIVFINELYQKYLENPNSIDKSWAVFFANNHEEVRSIIADYQGPSWGKRGLKVIGSIDYDISSNAPKEQPKKDAKT
ncbi:MAG: 2-oxoglutarate dehydrogenase E1 subunit family protein, partial [Alphaproteobacteria bacterium]